MKTQHADMASIYTNLNGLKHLKREAAANSPEATRETARQFEALFIKIMLKSMRDTVGKGIMDSDQSDMYRDLHDQQLSIHLAKKGSFGIGNMLMNQLGALDETTNSGKKITDYVAIPALPKKTYQPHLKNIQSATVSPQPPINKTRVSLNWQSKQDFIKSLHPAAQRAAQELGTRPEAILAIAALETGWGKHIMSTKEGVSSHNLFGIKANRSWQHEKTYASTLEFENGVMHRRKEPFRVYDSPNESIQDFANFILKNPRYQKALSVSTDPEQFIKEIHKAGYATDPVYAQKVTSIMRNVSDITKAF